MENRFHALLSSFETPKNRISPKKRQSLEFSLELPLQRFRPVGFFPERHGIEVDTPHGRMKLYEHVARTVADDWNASGNCALVVGATFPAEIARVRELAGDMPLLVPGIGAQGGDIAATLAAG
ncbi:MAG TPA: hypothetical protein PK364_11625, partial [Synergistaceae bacterium]|nr:hypothetical protein [Synergistaceae bacterium]